MDHMLFTYVSVGPTSPLERSDHWTIFQVMLRYNSSRVPYRTALSSNNNLEERTLS